MSRGMDFNNISTVINYDIPTHVQTYCHRCGRTARAGRRGTAITLCKQNEFHHYSEMLHRAENSFYEQMKIKKTALKPLLPTLQVTLDSSSHLCAVVLLFCLPCDCC